MRIYFAVLKVYISSLFDPRSLIASFRSGPKGIAKGVGIIALALYIIGAMAFLPLSIAVQTYQGLKPLGLESLVILNSVISATALTLFLGFITCFSTYFMTAAETYLLALPFKPRSLLAAKLSIVYISECALAFLFLASSLGVYAWFEHPGPLFYIYAALIILTTPLAPIALFYTLLVPLFSLVRWLRRKELIFIIAGIFGVAMALGLQLYYQKQMLGAQDPTWIIANLSSPDSILSRFAAAYPPALWAANALSKTGETAGFTEILKFIGLQAAAITAAIFLLAPSYVKSLATYGESAVRKLKDSRAFIGAGFRRSSRFRACLRRELRTMLNEPVFFFNGPFIIALLPLIFSIMYLTMKDEFIKELPFLSNPSALPLMTLAASAFAAMLGAMTSVSSTAVSRDGGQFGFLKSLPFTPLSYWGAKYAHSLIYAALSAIISPALLSLISPLGYSRALVAGFAGFGLSALLNLANLVVDTAFPHLNWNNPTVAMKQNPNAVIGAVGGMIFVAGFAYLGYLNLGNEWFLPLSGVLGFTLSAGGFIALLPWAGKTLAARE